MRIKNIAFITCLICSHVYGQTDSLRTLHQERGIGGIEAARSWRSDGFGGYFFRFFYEAEIEKIFFNAGFFSYQKINDGFGFDFRLRMPGIFYPSRSHTNFSPLAGFSFTVWPTYKSNVSIGIPIGLEYELPIDRFPNLSVAANLAPQFNLSTAFPNTVIYDLRIGITFD